MSGAFLDDAVDVVAVRDVKRPGAGFAALRGNLCGDRSGPLRVEIGDGDVGAFGGEHAGGGPPHATGGAGNEGG